MRNVSCNFPTTREPKPNQHPSRLCTRRSTVPSPDAASTLPDLYRVFNPAEIVSVEPTSIDRPVAGR